VLRLWTGEYDNDSVCVKSIETRDDGSMRNWLMAWRVQPDEIKQEIHECLRQIRTVPDADLGELATVPLPDVPEHLIQSLRSDMSFLTLRSLGEAADIISTPAFEEYGAVCMLRWHTGWTLYVSFQESLHGSATASCTLIDPNGDGVWSRKGISDTDGFKRAIDLLVSEARDEGFQPPDPYWFGILTDGYFERQIQLISEQEWVQ